MYTGNDRIQILYLGGALLEELAIPAPIALHYTSLAVASAPTTSRCALSGASPERDDASDRAIRGGGSKTARDPQHRMPQKDSIT